jgi:N-acetyl-gamma-glutamylphosphate reductase
VKGSLRTLPHHNGVSGYSGGGRRMIEAHNRDGGPAFELYALGLEHKHVSKDRSAVDGGPYAA